MYSFLEDIFSNLLLLPSDNSQQHIQKMYDHCVYTPTYLFFFSWKTNFQDGGEGPSWGSNNRIIHSHSYCSDIRVIGVLNKN